VLLCQKKERIAPHLVFPVSSPSSRNLTNMSHTLQYQKRIITKKEKAILTMSLHLPLITFNSEKSLYSSKTPMENSHRCFERAERDLNLE
jgi:hypothetical protein